LALDGYQKPVITVNGQFPGPPVYANLHDELHIDVKNELDAGEYFTLHFHGYYKQVHHGVMDLKA
jgi:iron transport multicopper oxidase